MKQNPFSLLTRGERLLWATSVCLVTGAFVCFGTAENRMTLPAALVGVTALIFVAKGHVLGQLLTVVFSVLYAIPSYVQGYYGEMVTYLGMTAPIAALSAIAWYRNPYEAGKAEVRVRKMTPRAWGMLAVLTVAVTAGLGVVLAWLHTAALPLSIVSIATSFAASALTLRRSAAYAVAYAANDAVLIALWLRASFAVPSYTPMVVCFALFFVNDLYGFFSWKRMARRQAIPQ